MLRTYLGQMVFEGFGLDLLRVRTEQSLSVQLNLPLSSLPAINLDMTNDDDNTFHTLNF